MGQRASEILLSEIKEKSIKQEVKIPVELIIRDSCKKIL
jgi:DNA-binding LacI/PurR family transcriptional regulator